MANSHLLAPDERLATLGRYLSFRAIHLSSDRGPTLYLRFPDGRFYKPKEQVGFQTRQNGKIGEIRACKPPLLQGLDDLSATLSLMTALKKPNPTRSSSI